MSRTAPGTLFLVATPIGNLEDITRRAVRVLGECDLVACEDTRHTRKLLAHLGISKPTISYHEHNEAARTPELLGKLGQGASIALVSDAGTPLVSDPGYRLVRAAVDAGITVTPVPGPSAVVAALAASGLPAGSFRFGGFLPPKPSQRARVLEGLKNEPATIVFYEAPHRVLGTLAQVEQILGARPVVVARELTKVHEEFLRGTAAEIRAELARRGGVKGEITLLIGRGETAAGGPEPGEPAADEGVPLEQAIADCIGRGIDRMEAIKAVAARRGLPKREVYKRFLGRGRGMLKD
ncbi:MAG: 16S rRNA (cytidine(1402)-2'-O)-methyltransferase [Acidobacteria bacterium]|nr:16S rRNA (cytidine(1402)-2'-O)-methyltransferase [Acidobacteriota bacterium]